MTADMMQFRLLLLTLAGWISRHQQDVIDYLVEENRILKEQHRGKALRLTDDQRRRLAAKAKRLGRQTLNRVATIVTPDTLLRLHRRLIETRVHVYYLLPTTGSRVSEIVSSMLRATISLKSISCADHKYPLSDPRFIVFSELIVTHSSATLLSGIDQQPMIKQTLRSTIRALSTVE